MDKESSRLLLKNILTEHPELGEELAPKREKMIVVSIRIAGSMMQQISELAKQQHQKKAEIIRYALRLGLKLIEKEG